MNCFENITMPSCVWFEGGERRNVIASMLAGLLFFAGWWFIIDSASVYPHNLPPASYVCGVFGTLSLLMVNSVTNAQLKSVWSFPSWSGFLSGIFKFEGKGNYWTTIALYLFVRGETYNGGCMGSRGARLWLFLGFVIGFASLIAACWILFANYVNVEKTVWPGVSLFMQNALIFAGSLVFKFGRTEDLWA